MKEKMYKGENILSFFNKLKIAICGFGQTEKLKGASSASTVGYGVIVILLCAVIASASVYIRALSSNGAGRAINELLGDFKLTSSAIECEKADLTDQNNSLYIYADTSGETDIKSVARKNMQTEFLIDKDEVLVHSSQGDVIYTAKQIYTNLVLLGVIPKKDSANVSYIDKPAILQYMATSKFKVLFISAMFIAMLFIQCVMFGLTLLIAASVLNMLKHFFKKRIPLGTVIKISCYIITFPMLFSSAFFGIEFVSVFITLIYCYLAIKNIRGEEGVVLATLEE